MELYYTIYARCRFGIWTAIETIGAPGPETLEETCKRAAAKIRGLEAQLKVASDDWDDLNVRSGEHIHELEDRLHILRAPKDDAESEVRVLKERLPMLEAKARVHDCAREASRWQGVDGAAWAHWALELDKAESVLRSLKTKERSDG